MLLYLNNKNKEFQVIVLIKNPPFRIVIKKRIRGITSVPLKYIHQMPTQLEIVFSNIFRNK